MGRRNVMAKDDSPTGFEIPAEMRALAEKSVEQAKTAFDSFIAAAQNAVSEAEKQASGARDGVREVSQLAMRFAERNLASSFDYAQKLARAKDAQEVIGLHADYANSQVAALTEQAKELSQSAAKVAGKAAKGAKD
jgi:phasin